jgi:hypothetical protein
LGIFTQFLKKGVQIFDRREIFLNPAWVGKFSEITTRKSPEISAEIFAGNSPEFSAGPGLRMLDFPKSVWCTKICRKLKFGNRMKKAHSPDEMGFFVLSISPSREYSRYNCALGDPELCH